MHSNMTPKLWRVAVLQSINRGSVSMNRKAYERSILYIDKSDITYTHIHSHIFTCVCVCEREREREGIDNRYEGSKCHEEGT